MGRTQSRDRQYQLMRSQGPPSVFLADPHTQYFTGQPYLMMIIAAARQPQIIYDSASTLVGQPLRELDCLVYEIQVKGFPAVLRSLLAVGNMKSIQMLPQFSVYLNIQISLLSASINRAQLWLFLTMPRKFNGHQTCIYADWGAGWSQWGAYLCKSFLFLSIMFQMNAKLGLTLAVMLMLVAPGAMAGRMMSAQRSSPPRVPEPRQARPQVVELQCGQGKVSNKDNLCIEPEYIEGCETYLNSNQCWKCAKGYIKDERKGLCSAQTNARLGQSLPGCLEFSGPGKCSNCANGFRKQGDTCVRGIKHCTAYGSKGECTGCGIEYSLIFGHCKHNVLLGCKIEVEDHTCKECFAPFKLTALRCDIPNCKTLNDYGCVACECGFYLTEQKQCNKMINGCLRYERGMCKNCLPHYRLKGGACEIEGCVDYAGNICRRCKEDNYELTSNGECHFKNCFDWIDDKCLICEEGFSLKGSLCVKTTPIVCSA